MNIKDKKIICEILSWCLEDYIDLLCIFSIIQKKIETFSINETKIYVIKILKYLINNDLLKVGFAKKNGSFEQWKLENNKCINKIIMDWKTLETKKELSLGDIAWFDLTEKGRKKFEYLNNLPELK